MEDRERNREQTNGNIHTTERNWQRNRGYYKKESEQKLEGKNVLRRETQQNNGVKNFDHQPNE